MHAPGTSTAHWQFMFYVVLLLRCRGQQDSKYVSANNGLDFMKTLELIYDNDTETAATHAGGIETSGEAQPAFENATQRSVVVAVGRTANLYCRVRNLGDRAVSWIRKRDLHILTIGVMTYTNDQRFAAHHQNNTSEWRLKIVSVQPRDEGIYECQISTEPKISQAYRLTVVVAKATILADPLLVFQTGSDINLTCIAQQMPMPPTYIYWYKDGGLINHSQRGGINVLTERLKKTSKLLIAKAVPADSGNYTCTPSNANSDTVSVHVINKEDPAAMQHENATMKSLSKLLFALMLMNAFKTFYDHTKNFIQIVKR